MGNIITYLNNGPRTDNTNTQEVSESSGLSSQSSEDSETMDTPTNFFRLPCGKIRPYSTLNDHGQFGKDFRRMNGGWGTGPYKNWESMIVDSDAVDFKYLKPYEKDIDGNFYKNDDGEISSCKNCEAYGYYEKYGPDIMICTKRCINCINANYQYKIMRIQRKWREYKHIDKKFEWDWRQGFFVPEGMTLRPEDYDSDH